MNQEPLLTSEQVVAEARKLGVEISQRTLKFYVSQGLLPHPERHPSDSVDKRVLFFPARVLGILAEIRRLQESGLTLQQIRRYLAGNARPDLQVLARESNSEGSRIAEQVVKALFSQEVSQAYQDFLTLPAEAGDQAVRQLGREFYERVLQALIGARQARHLVARTFDRLTPAQWERKLAPLLQLRARHSGRRAGTGGNVLARTLTSHLRDLAGRIREGQNPEAELAQVKARLERLTLKYAGVPETNPHRHEIARFMAKALEVFGEALWMLEEASHSQDPSLIDRALSRAQKAGDILDHLEGMVAEKRALLRLCHEEDLQLP